VLQWTYGVRVLTGEKSAMDPKKLIRNPILISLVLGLVFLILPVQMPPVIKKTISGIAAMNAPAAMLILGVYIAQTRLLSLFTKPRLYGLCAVRLILIPVLTVLLFRCFPFIDNTLRMSIIVAACAPVGSNVAIYAQQNGSDYGYACQTVCLSTIFSILTMPLLIMLTNWVL